MESEKIKELLQNRFNLTPMFPKKRHIIFWYDEGGAFKDSLDELLLEGVKIIKLEKSMNKKDEEISINIFKTKYTLEVSDLESNYLIYSEYSKPENDNENFLLDIESYSEYFKADRTAMIIEELSLDRLDYELIKTIEKYEVFFHNKERKERLQKLLDGEEKKASNELKLGILAVLSGSKTLNLREIIKNIILDESKLKSIEKWMGLDYLYSSLKEEFNLEVDSFDKFMKIGVVVHFSKELREKSHLNLENYYVGDRNEIYLFFDSLLQNRGTSDIIKKQFFKIGKELNFREKIDKLDLSKVVLGTGFEYFDIVIIKELSERLRDEYVQFEKYKKYINVRLDNSLWKDKYFELYNGLLAGINLLELKKEFRINETSNLSELYKNYTEDYYKIDRLYRDFFHSYDNAETGEMNGVLDNLEGMISSFYEKDYLEPLLNVWSNNIDGKDRLPQQNEFYNNHVRKSDTRVAVIVSDALRYEVGVQIKEKLLKEANTKEISLTGMLTSLPSITSCGMANLLPFSETVNLDIDGKKVTLKGVDTRSTQNRENILKMAEKESSASTFNSFKNMYRSEQEEFVKGKKVIYIYHDSIDAIGDKAKTESQTFEAVKTAVTDIVGMGKLLSSLGVVNIFITSDHGFLYERKEVEEHDKLEFKNSYSMLGKRYGLSHERYEEKGSVTIDLGGYYGVFPQKNQRIKSSGGGLQFVHGGASPQEMIVPLIKYRSGINATKSRKVNVKLRESIGKITSTLTKFGVYQLDPVNIGDKVIERDVVIALYTLNGVKVSSEEKIRLNSLEENNLTSFRLSLSGTHDKVLLKVLDLDSGDILDSKEYEVNLSMATDFDF
ncbi:MAG: BREX-1 system phosphatase PglZ type A [Cetobacterium sp.]